MIATSMRELIMDELSGFRDSHASTTSRNNKTDLEPNDPVVDLKLQLLRQSGKLNILEKSSENCTEHY
jgi:hypothetical protein